MYLCENDTIIPTIVKYLYKIGAVIFFLIVEVSANAQCAMCKATVESNPDVGGGINAGIEYILVFPYLLLSLFAILVFRGKLIPFWKDLIGKGKEDKTKNIYCQRMVLEQWEIWI